MPHGYGRFISSFNEQIYIGQWKKGKKGGNGEMIDTKTGQIYLGEWAHDQRNGRGQEYYADGTTLNATFINDIKCGECIT